jgi:predicted naringenin-chalcone synthase
MTKAFISGTGIFFPKTTLTLDNYLKITNRLREKEGQNERLIEFSSRVNRNMAISSRRTIHPAWGSEGHINADEIEDILTPYNFNPPFYLRMKLWAKYAPKLALGAAKEALASWAGNSDCITHVVTGTTTGWCEPGIASYLVDNLELSEHCQKTEINFNGCFAGMTCLRMARELVKACPGRVVLVVNSEAASSHYDVYSEDPAVILANGLFADGASSAIVSSQGEWELCDFAASTIKGTSQLMSWKAPTTQEMQNYHIYLDKHLPDKLGEYFEHGYGKFLLEKLNLNNHSKIKLAAHPGGRGILDAIKKVIVKRGLPENLLDESYHVLNKYGNLASAATKTVLHQMLNINNNEVDEVLALGFGPGVTVEWGLIKRL